ncbi:hypothetical protein [Paractinoplanes globisporus]|uniref:Uncharacterized protein n=1 Tax=Paractinoplanes globisporus TaxID=113565 RepID=A0ABW6WEV9_9ACTN|nr:hypothetical protein [Actinoplanes globisporus]
MHIRQRIRDRAVHFGVGLVVAAVGVVVTGFLSAWVGPAGSMLITVAWWFCGLLAAVALLGLTVTAGWYVWYRRRRPSLDAAGAEAYGERRARLHRPRDDGAPR